MPESDACRKRAEECKALAEKATNPDTKRQYEEMARGWLVLAKIAEQRELPKQ
jgi:hypothetical protein